MSYDQYSKDPLENEVDHFVHPNETRSNGQIAHDEGLDSRLHMSGDDDPDAYWGDHDKLYDDKVSEPKAEDTYDFTEEDIGLYRSATAWLEGAAASYEKQVEKFGNIVANGLPCAGESLIMCRARRKLLDSPMSIFSS